MADLIRSRATNHYALSTAKFYAGFEPLLKHELLRSLDLTKFTSAEAIVETVFFAGSLVQKSAILSTLDATCDLSVPEISNYKRNVGQEALKASILQCCDFFGKAFEGNLDQYVVTLYDSYGGLSIMEWMRFFKQVTELKFKEDYQHISVRGLNPDFITDWIEKFCEKRDDIVQSLRKELPDAASPADGADPFSFEEYKAVQRKERAIESQVRTRRLEIEGALTFRRMQVLEIPTHTADGIHLEKQSVPMVIDNAGASLKRLETFFEVYYTPFSNEPAASAVARLKIQWDLELRYWSEGENEGMVPEKATWYASQAKKLLIELSRVIENYHQFLMSTIRRLSTGHPDTHELWAVCGGIIPYPASDRKAEDNDFFFIAGQKIIHYTSHYIESAERRLEQGRFPLYRNEFYSLCALNFYVKTAGFEHPFSPIFT